MTITRRGILRAGAGVTLANLLPLRGARADAGIPTRLIVFYWPDGVASLSEEGQPSPFHARGTTFDFQLTHQVEALQPFKQDCVFLNGVSLGPTDIGSHPGGAKKLLTARDGGSGESLDQWLGRNVGAMFPHRAVVLGAMATHNNASGDRFISYAGAGQTVAPEDNPATAFSRLFGRAPGTTGGTTGTGTGSTTRRSVLDVVLADLNDMQGALGNTERSKLALHLESLREIEQRVDAAMMSTMTSCSTWSPSTSVPAEQVFDAARFPDVLRLQTDILVQAMACGLTRVGVLQGSTHTSELIMSRFAGTEMYVPNFDMRSHQASHYGPRHDETRTEYWHYLRQRRWWMAQLAYLLGRLKAVPEGDGTMLDHTVVLACTEVSDGNTHSHDNIPFIVGGRGGHRISTGRLLQFGYERHGKLLASIANVMGANIAGWGDAGDGLLPGLIT